MQVQDAYRTQQLYACRLSLPKHGINSEFVHFMNQDNEIVAEHFAQGLVDHSYVRLAAKAISEFPFHHAKRRFDVAAFVVVLQELRAPERKVMVHLLPRSPAVASVMGCEGDKRRGSRRWRPAEAFALLAYPLSAETSAIWKFFAVVSTIAGSNGESLAFRS